MGRMGLMGRMGERDEDPYGHKRPYLAFLSQFGNITDMRDVICFKSGPAGVKWMG